ncbi:MAG: hypothetical protein P8172_10315 [Gammaproteobacteria bacterium]
MTEARRTDGGAIRISALTVAVLGTLLGGCVTARLEQEKSATTGITDGEAVVVMAKSYHLGNETESDFTDCVGKSLGKGREGLAVMPDEQFVDALFPWLEPRTAPAEAKALQQFMQRPRVRERIRESGVRYIVWLDGDTERTGGGGSLSCAAGPGGGGCFGFAWWETDSNYQASIWDLKEMKSAGSVKADVSGTSYLPAIVIPVPLIARTQSAACKNLADRLRTFIVGTETTS